MSCCEDKSRLALLWSPEPITAQVDWEQLVREDAERMLDLGGTDVEDSRDLCM